MTSNAVGIAHTKVDLAVVGIIVSHISSLFIHIFDIRESWSGRFISNFSNKNLARASFFAKEKYKFATFNSH